MNNVIIKKKTLNSNSVNIKHKGLTELCPLISQKKNFVLGKGWLIRNSSFSFTENKMIMIMTYCCLLLKGYWFYVLIFLSASYNWISVENLTTMRVSDWIRFNLYLRTQKLSSILVNWIVERNDNFITISLKKKKEKSHILSLKK